MRSRCNSERNPFYSRYGGRGISVCSRWSDFEVFLADMGDRPRGMSLDRINNDGNYEPSNCRWATPSQQGRNKRGNAIVEFNGRSVTIAELSEMSSIPYGLLYDRIFRSGWTVDKALFHPVRKWPGEKPGSRWK